MHVSSSILRMQIMCFLFNYPHLYSFLKRSKLFVKIDKSEDKEQALEKLLQSDLYPPLRYTKDVRTTFVSGGQGRLTSINFSISSDSLNTWSSVNHIKESCSVL